MTHGYGVAAAVRAVPLPVLIPESSLLLAQFATMAAQMEAWEAKTAPPCSPKKSRRIVIVTLMGSMLTRAKSAATNPGPNHNAQATARNTMGGADAKRRVRRT